MELMYRSTRGDEKAVTASQAILQGLAPDGGLYVPDSIPAFDKSLEELCSLDYRQTAYEILKLFLTDFTEEELHYCIDNAYDSKFDVPEIAPVKKAGGVYFLELFHGKTIAFKDMALSILPYFMTVSAKKNNIKDEIVILTATSGDTGKAALAGFADVPGTRILVYYPKHGVSKIQELQMVTQKGGNTRVVGILGNFDDAQTGVKNLFSDKALAERMAKKGFRFSSANSINIGRLVPQVVYYVWAYGNLVKNGTVKVGDPVNFTVPTGNFGNILAGYFAKCMGLPIDRLICASNENKVLFDFFETGVYDRNREFVLTTSPSMDILISSNLERLVYLSCGRDARKCAAFMQELRTEGKYTITPEMRDYMRDFVGFFASKEETADAIKDLFGADHYLMDTHTGVAFAGYKKFFEKEQDTKPMVIVSTASPYKFGGSVMKAVKGADFEAADDFVLADIMEKESGVAVPEAVRELKTAAVLHDHICAKDDLLSEVEVFLGL